MRDMCAQKMEGQLNKDRKYKGGVRTHDKPKCQQRHKGHFFDGTSLLLPILRFCMRCQKPHKNI